MYRGTYSTSFLRLALGIHLSAMIETLELSDNPVQTGADETGVMTTKTAQPVHF